AVTQRPNGGGINSSKSQRSPGGIERHGASQGSELPARPIGIPTPAQRLRPSRDLQPRGPPQHHPPPPPPLPPRRVPPHPRRASPPPMPGTPGRPSTVSPSSASRSGIRSGGTPYRWRTASSSIGAPSPNG